MTIKEMLHDFFFNVERDNDEGVIEIRLSHRRYRQLVLETNSIAFPRPPEALTIHRLEMAGAELPPFIEFEGRRILPEEEMR